MTREERTKKQFERMAQWEQTDKEFEKMGEKKSCNDSCNDIWREATSNLGRSYSQYATTSNEDKIVIDIKDYSEYWLQLSDKLKTMDVDEINSRHRCYCANCGGQFSKEALQQLCITQAYGGAVTIRNPTPQGTGFRSGKCPACGHTKMRILIDK
jgi:hypothetical protein